ncbi:HAD family hydrolase [Thalassovita sp.]|uniref:HAD family hydrolase n=1 Tax=Thalassovita sp. TaxID=1979401 RepID=UPI002B270AF0|nr:HAD family hydrolase [Thalassovita sp.]
MKIAGILFDKDGTLFDFRATWDVWAVDLIADLSAGDAGLADRIAEAIAFDLVNRQFLPHSPVIAGTNREAAECVASALPMHRVEDLEIVLIESAANAPLAPAVPLPALLDGLAQRGLALGVMTNDSEQAARAHLSHARIDGKLDFIAGFDSGFGAKPAPEPLLAFASQTGLSPETVIMVGDSTHDLLAGRRAGMHTLGVLTGIAPAEELSLLADAVLPDIGHIPAWLDALTV